MSKIPNILHSSEKSDFTGRIAALNMLEKPTELSSVPFYWTVLLGKTIRYAGGNAHTHTPLSQVMLLYYCILSAVFLLLFPAICEPIWNEFVKQIHKLLTRNVEICHLLQPTTRGQN